MDYETVVELMQAFRHRKRFVLVRGQPATEKQIVFARTLAETRCSAVSDEQRVELIGMIGEMNQEWTKRAIDTLLAHPKKSRTCWRCFAKEMVSES